MRGVHAHDLPFGVVQLARLVEDGVADAELTNVVQQCGTLEPASLLGAELQLLRDHVGEQRDTFAVAAGVRTWNPPPGRRRPRCRRDSPRLSARSPAPAVGARPPRARRRCEAYPRTQAAPRCAQRPLPGAGRTTYPTGSGLRAAPPRGRSRRGTHRSPVPSARGERSGWPYRADPAAYRHHPSARRGFDAVGDRLGEAHFAGDVGAAMAARLDQLAGDLPPFWKMLTMARNVRRGRFSGRYGPARAGLRQAAVDELEVLFEKEIVGQIQLADPRRIAAAAEILQEQF